MKYILLIFVICVLIQHAFSQVYYPLVKGNQWDYSYSSSFESSFFSIVVTGDTILSNGKKYAIKMQENNVGQVSFDSYERFSNDTVYRYYNSNDQVRWVFFNRDTTYHISGFTYTKKTDTVNINGHYLRRWLNGYNSTSTVNFNGTVFIDSIGYFETYHYSELPRGTTCVAAITKNIIFGKPVKTTLDIQQKHDPIADDYLLQNYPNPFNPTTTISYSILKQSIVSLKIYNYLGQEIISLINENKNAGTYSIIWNASNYTSGIYFYRIQTDKYIQTKKMLLLK